MQDGGYVGETQEDGLMGGTASLDIGYYWPCILRWVLDFEYSQWPKLKFEY